jgi:hypothetical protein
MLRRDAPMGVTTHRTFPGARSPTPHSPSPPLHSHGRRNVGDCTVTIAFLATRQAELVPWSRGLGQPYPLLLQAGWGARRAASRLPHGGLTPCLPPGEALSVTMRPVGGCERTRVPVRAAAAAESRGKPPSSPERRSLRGPALLPPLLSSPGYTCQPDTYVTWRQTGRFECRGRPAGLVGQKCIVVCKCLQCLRRLPSRQ